VNEGRVKKMKINDSDDNSGRKKKEQAITNSGTTSHPVRMMVPVCLGAYKTGTMWMHKLPGQAREALLGPGPWGSSQPLTVGPTREMANTEPQSNIATSPELTYQCHSHRDNQINTKYSVFLVLTRR
jgi:hypothetical protein